MDAKEWLKEGLINPNILIDTIEGEKPLWFILKAYHASRMPSDETIKAWVAHRGLRDQLLIGSRTRPIYLEGLIIEFKQSLK